MLRLSKRLETIAKQVPAGSRMADIGSDHALLPSYLAEQGKIIKAVAGEVNPGPYQAASKQVQASRLGSIIDVRLGDGLAVISAGEVEVITIAGMGGALIASILDAGQDKLEGVRMLILQPNVGESLVRIWLLEHGWILTNEQILEEDGKIYEILTAVPAALTEKTNEEVYSPYELSAGLVANQSLLLKLGPYLIKQPESVWFQKWGLELDKLDMIRRQLSHSTLEESRVKEQAIITEIEQIKEVLACL
jgi:tRNA (adenine22-N1)-methyltransferase